MLELSALFGAQIRFFHKYFRKVWLTGTEPWLTNVPTLSMSLANASRVCQTKFERNPCWDESLWKNDDYTSAGCYFITICVHERKDLCGEIVDQKTVLNRYGQIACDEWQNTATIRRNVAVDAFVVMPNHVHGIIIIHDGGTGRRAPTDNVHEQFGKPVSNSIPTIIRSYKATVTKQINQLRRTPGVRVWQRNYYEHIIRDERGLYNIRQYIQNNPVHWVFDRENINVKSLEEKKRYWKQFFENLHPKQ